MLERAGFQGAPCLLDPSRLVWYSVNIAGTHVCRAPSIASPTPIRCARSDGCCEGKMHSYVVDGVLRTGYILHQYVSGAV